MKKDNFRSLAAYFLLGILFSSTLFSCIFKNTWILFAGLFVMFFIVLILAIYNSLNEGVK